MFRTRPDSEESPTDGMIKLKTPIQLRAEQSRCQNVDKGKLSQRNDLMRALCFFDAVRCRFLIKLHRGKLENNLINIVYFLAHVHKGAL